MKRHPFIRAFTDRLHGAWHHYRDLVHALGPGHPESRRVRACLRAWLACY